MTTERFKLACNCKLNDNETIIRAGTPVKLLQIIGTQVLIEILLGEGIQKVVDPQDLQLYGTPMWCYDIEYILEKVDLEDEEASQGDEEFETYGS